MFRQTLSRCVVAALVLGSAACASAKPAASTTDAGAVAATSAPRRDRSTITAEEIAPLQVANLYEAVRRLHPEWLVARTTMTPGSARTAQPVASIQVYVDGQKMGDAEHLKQFTVGSAVALKFYSAADAQTRFGLGNLNGVIEVITKR